MLFVTAKKPLKVKHGKTKNEKGQEIDKVLDVPSEYAQFESIDEAIQDAGSPENLLKYINSSVKADSATPVRNYKAAEGVTDDVVISKAGALRKDFSIKNTIRDGLSQKEKAETLDEVTKLAEAGASAEDILAAIRRTRQA